MAVSSFHLGIIAAYYNISYIIVEVSTCPLKERPMLKGLLEVVFLSAKFETVPIGCHEHILLDRKSVV